jgi:tetratricopeptide (TPR) repeat protein
MFRYYAACVVLSAFGVLGCATPSLPTTLGTSNPISDKNELARLTGKPKEPELAPNKAAQLCMAAAEELEKGGHYAHAIAECELARHHSPNMAGLSRKLANLYAREGEFDKALAEYTKELNKSPKDADLLNDMGYCCYQMKDYPAAEKYLRQAVIAKPQLQRAQGNLGLALGRQQKWRESMEAFKKAGPSATAHANLAAMYHAAGRDDDAQRECRIALSMDPKLQTTQELLAKLEEDSKEQYAIHQAEVRMIASNTPMVRTAEATQDVGAIKLSRPIVTKKVDPEFKPAR